MIQPSRALCASLLLALSPLAFTTALAAQEAPAAEAAAGEALKDLGVNLQQAFSSALGKCIERHVTAMVRPTSPVLHWQWGLTIWAWLLETLVIHKTPATSPNLFETILADVGITARARRQRPSPRGPKGEQSWSLERACLA